MKKYIQYIFIFLILSACQSQEETKQIDTLNSSWQEIEASAKGQSLTMMMWQGDPYINKFMNQYVKLELKKRFKIDLEIVSGQGTQIVSTMMTEKQAGKTESDIDMVWINGETFYQLRQLDVLFGPFTDKLPNAQYIDFENKFITYDFQEKVDGYECPWGNVQLALIYNSDKVKNPPKTLDELEKWVRKNPYRFTIPNEFTGMTLLKSWLYALADDKKELLGKFNPEVYQRVSAKLWKFINKNKQYFWKKGETFPSTLVQMHQLFANGELDFTMSNNDGEVDNKIAQGVFPKNSRSFVFDSGTIQNSHFLGIVSNAKHKAAAMLVINFLISPEAQLEKFKPSVWGDGTVLSMNKLPKEIRTQFESQPERKYALPRAKIQDKALMEPAPEYMINLSKDFREKVIEN